MITIDPPHAIEAEENLLSCCLLDGAGVVAQCVAASVGPESFYLFSHGVIFQCVVALSARREPIDVSTVAEELRTRGQLDSVGGYPFLTQVSSRLPTTLHAGFFIEKIVDLAKQRRLQSSLAGATEAAKRTGTWREIWDFVEPHLQAVRDTAADTRQRSLADITAQAVCWRLRPDERPATATPWPGWDRVAGTPREGELIVIAGRPGTGKTTFAGCIAHDAAARGQIAAFFSLEMSGEELVDRFALRRAGRKGIGNDRHANAIVAEQIEAIGAMQALRLYESQDAASITQIEATCRLLAAAPGRLAAVVIDYLQLVTPPADTKREVREQQVAAMSRRFKLLARAIGCPVFLCAQLNRESEKDERRPRTSDLRESGAIEQDADRCWLLYRPKPKPGEALPSEDANEIEVMLYQAKCRNGPAGIEAMLRFHRATFNFLAE